MVYIVIGTVEYARRLFRLQNRKNHAFEDVVKHKQKLQKYMDARERLNGSKRRNGHALNEKIDSPKILIYRKSGFTLFFKINKYF